MECNSYFVVGRSVALIDPGFNPRKVSDKGREYNIELNCFINTHCHFDHSGGGFSLRENGVLCMVHELDADAVESGDDGFILGGLFGKSPVACKVDRRLVGGEVIDLGGMKLEVVHTPGHTPGSICLYEPDTKSLFSGDTLFADGVGRTDLPGGDEGKLKESIGKLVGLYKSKGISRVYPGHGPIGRSSLIEKVFKEYFG